MEYFLNVDPDQITCLLILNILILNNHIVDD